MHLRIDAVMISSASDGREHEAQRHILHYLLNVCYFLILIN